MSSTTTAAAAADSKAGATAIHDFSSIPVIDIQPLFLPKGNAENEQKRRAVASSLYDACRRVGFFYVKNHGIGKALVDRVFSEGKRFFSLPVSEKNAIHMKHSDCYRGYFMLGEELTSKKKDWKEGLYFGAECGADHPSVIAKVPMHGPNQWPDAKSFPGFDKLILDYMAACTELGHVILTGIAIGLGLEEDYFRTRFTTEPFTPFRLFWYPTELSPAEAEQMQKAAAVEEGKSGGDAKAITAAPTADAKSTAAAAAGAAPAKATFSGGYGSNTGPTTAGGDGKWGVGEHTDYGVLTILGQDDVGGLEVKNCRGEWVSAPPIADTFVINIGDMLQIWTNGLFPATPHRVVKSTKSNRLSAPFFFDPNFSCVVSPLALPGTKPDPNVKPISYGGYILKKVQNNFVNVEFTKPVN